MDEGDGEHVDLLQIRKTSLDLAADISNQENREDKKLIIEEHIKKIENNEAIYMPQTTEGLEWINTVMPLQFPDHLKGKVILYDFFTYCCINCMHILPYIAAVEKKFSFEDGLVVIGVHSAKFDNERIKENIENAILRHDIKHPVINDNEGSLWNQLSILCWPTILIVGPENQILFELVGEGGKENIELYVETTLNYFKKNQRISSHQLPATTSKQKKKSSTLYFPSKLSVDDTGDLIAIVDCGNHRILIVNREGYLKYCVGGNGPGFLDGKFNIALFQSPQGVTWINSYTICVADTENHALREINLETKLVRTLAGTGNQGEDKIGVNLGIEQSLASPWDLELNNSDSGDNAHLFIAMAGLHQIWNYFYQEGYWLKNKYLPTACVCIAGSGNEENRNNAYAHKAAFAQPSGISVGIIDDVKYLFIADSESSTIRQMSLENGCVKGVVGGERDPKNLFGFGDQDGTGILAKLQHPLGIVWNKRDSLLYISDTYNHKIKAINPRDKSCITVCGSGKPGNKITEDLLECELNEPNGLSFDPDGRFLFIADTNNHAIKILDIVSSKLSHFLIRCNEPLEKKKLHKSKSHHVINCNEIKLKLGGTITLIPRITTRGHLVINNDAPNKHELHVPSSCNGSLKITEENQYLPSSCKISLTAEHLFPPVVVELESTIYFCKKNDGICLMRIILFQIPMSTSMCDIDGIQNESIELKYCIEDVL